MPFFTRPIMQSNCYVLKYVQCYYKYYSVHVLCKTVLLKWATFSCWLMLSFYRLLVKRRLVLCICLLRL